MARNDPPTAMSTRFGYRQAHAAGVPWGAIQPNDSGKKYSAKCDKAEKARAKDEFIQATALDLVQRLGLDHNAALLRAGALWAAQQRKKDKR